jgi:hypothetical protein
MLLIVLLCSTEYTASQTFQAYFSESWTAKLLAAGKGLLFIGTTSRAVG